MQGDEMGWGSEHSRMNEGPNPLVVDEKTLRPKRPYRSSPMTTVGSIPPVPQAVPVHPVRNSRAASSGADVIRDDQAISIGSHVHQAVRMVPCHDRCSHETARVIERPAWRVRRSSSIEPRDHEVTCESPTFGLSTL